MAMAAYYLKGIAPAFVQLWTIFKGCLPFVLMVFITMAAIYIFPQTVFWLPDLMYGMR
jgi:TRAP-type mannitol/chloroaromatic compound transport system permease large subunit